MRWARGAALVLVAMGVLTAGAFAQDQVGLRDGGVLECSVGPGIPELMRFDDLGIGERVTIRRGEISIIYFSFGERDGEPYDYLVMADGSARIGRIAALAPEITVRTLSGEPRTLSVENIEYIKFDTPQRDPDPVPMSDCVELLVGNYKDSRWGFTLGLGYFLVGVTRYTGFGYPQQAFGATATLGLSFRWYVTPGPLTVERALVEQCSDVCAAEDPNKMQEAAIECLGISRFFYIHVGTDFTLLFPSIGPGLQLGIGRNAFVDAGVVWNPNFLWNPPLLPYIGVMIVF